MPHPGIPLAVPLPPSSPDHYHIYFLRCSDGGLYIGQTCNLQERLRKHAYGLGSTYTKEHPPTQLIYTEACTPVAASG